MQTLLLKLYLVARWGNDEDGPNGSDTLFLVRAQDYQSAAEVVDCALAELKETRVASVSNWVCEIGDDKSGQIAPAILKGPFWGLSAADGYTSVWTRESMHDAWVSQKPAIEAARRQRS
jgi:hypothetical protein